MPVRVPDPTAPPDPNNPNPYTAPVNPTAPATTPNPYPVPDANAAPTARDPKTTPSLGPQTPAPRAPNGPSSSTITLGGGWQQWATPGTIQYALMEGLMSGQSGQALVDTLNDNPATAGIAYYASTGIYGLPDGFYVAPEAGDPNKLDLIQRPGGGGSGATGNVPTSVPPVAGLANDPNAASLYNLLMQQATQNPDVLPTDPTVQAATAAAQVQAQNAATTYEQQQAESQGSGANIQAQSRAAEENVGQTTAGIQAQTMQAVMTQRISEIENALNGAQGLLTTEQQMQLTQELAQLQDALQLAGLNLNAYEFDNNPATNPLVP